MLVNWCFEPSQTPRIISELKETFIKRNKVDRTNKADIRPEEQNKIIYDTMSYTVLPVFEKCETGQKYQKQITSSKVRFISKCFTTPQHV